MMLLLLLLVVGGQTDSDWPTEVSMIQQTMAIPKNLLRMRSLFFQFLTVVCTTYALYVSLAQRSTHHHGDKFAIFEDS